jgi:hypothetical protein
VPIQPPIFTFTLMRAGLLRLLLLLLLLLMLLLLLLLLLLTCHAVNGTLCHVLTCLPQRLYLYPYLVLMVRVYVYIMYCTVGSDSYPSVTDPGSCLRYCQLTAILYRCNRQSYRRRQPGLPRLWYVLLCYVMLSNQYGHPL